MNDKDDLVRCVWLHHVHFQIHAELEQLHKGVYQTLQFELLTISYLDAVWGMFAASDNFRVTPAFLCDSFSVQYSHNGSNNLTKEETIVLHWNEYIYNCPSTGPVSLGDIMQFISVSSRVPATEFDKTPSIKFTDVDCLPTVSTFNISITFPRKMAVMNYEEFQEKMDFCILGSYGFGKVETCFTC